MDVLAELVAKITADATQFKKALSDSERAAEKSSKSIQQTLKNVGQSMTNVGKQMSMKITAPIVGVATVAYKMSGDFDQAFRRVNVMLGVSANEAETYKKRILEISTATGKSATDVADAFYQIVSAGYRGADSLDILEVAMRGAVGGAAETESTMAALTKAMNIFALSGVEGSTKAMDIFFGIVDTGLLSFEQMASAFPNAAASAAGLGVSIEETGAALGTLSKVTGSTDDAATALANAFMQLIKPSDKLKDLYTEWGVKSGPEAIEKFGGFAGVLNAVSEATEGEVDKLAELFPSIRAIKAVLPLVTTNADDFASALKTVSGSTGRTNDAFDEMAQGAGFALQQAITKLKNASISLGDVLAKHISPILGKITDGIGKLVAWFENLNPEVRTAIIIFMGAAAAIGPLLLILGQLSLGLSAIISLAPMMGAAFTLMMGPIGLIVAAIGALVAVGVLVYKNWETIRTKASEIWNNIVNFFKNIWEKIVAVFKEHWDLILAILFPSIGLPILIAKNWDAIKEYIKGLWDKVTQIISDWWGSITAFFSKMNPWEWIKQGWTKLKEGIKGVLKGIFGGSDVENWMAGLQSYFASQDLSPSGEQMFETLRLAVAGKLDEITWLTQDQISKLQNWLGTQELSISGVTTEGKITEEKLEPELGYARIGQYNIPIPPEGTEINVGGKTQWVMPGDIVPLQSGGILTQPTIGLLGEAGPEAVIPLDEMPSNITIQFTQPVFFDREDSMNVFVDKISKAIDRKYRLRFGQAYGG